MIELELRWIGSTQVELREWVPKSSEDVYLCIDMEIGAKGDDRVDWFYVNLLTPEALKDNSREFRGDKRIIVMNEYSLEALICEVNKILARCGRASWQDSCLALTKYFQWEYETYPRS